MALDDQVAKKEAAKKKERDQRVKDLEVTRKEFEAFTAEEKKKKEMIRTKARTHASLVKEQMNEEPRMFAKTGVAIINN